MTTQSNGKRIQRVMCLVRHVESVSTAGDGALTACIADAGM
jgi:hypothetical protein